MAGDEVAAVAANAERAPNPINISVLGKLPKFDGRTSVKKFLKSIEKRSQLEKWEEPDKARIVQYLCVDLAEAFIDSNPELENASFTDLSDRLLARFGPKISKPEAYTELMSVQQRRQSIDEYAGQIESTAANLSDILVELQDVEKRDELLVSVFMSGLDANIKRSLIVNEYKAFSDIVRAAKRYERTFDHQKNVNALDSQNLRSNQLGQVNFRLPASDRSPYQNVTCWNCGKRGHIQRYCHGPPRNQPIRVDRRRHDASHANRKYSKN